MERKLVCIDLDSTFLKSDLSISDKSKEFVKKFVEDGNYFIINTGRPHQGAVQFLKQLKIHQPMIVNNGSAIVEYNEDYTKVISYHLFEMNIDLVKEFYCETKKFINTCAITSIFDFYSPDLNKCPFFIIHQNNQISFHEGDIDKLLNTIPLRSEYYVKDQFVEDFKKILNQEKYLREFEFIYWGSWDGIHSFEIYSKNASKGKAMDFLAKKLGILHKNTFAFGDQLNDISMIEYAYDGVAIFNARDEVKEISNHITKNDNNQDGVVIYLEELNLV
jgi:Cof subfamily protein (haloacid dehalogenase superfamily)